MSKSAYTTYEVSKICNVTMKTITEWVNEGELPAFKTLGGHRRIKEDDLISFLKQNNIPFTEDLRDKQFRRVLIIDDEPKIIKFIAEILRKQYPKIELDSAIDGFEAGKKVVNFKPDLVILDLKLPGIDGFEVCRSIRKDEKLKHTKIIAITGYDTAETRKKIFKFGANDYLAKPFDMNKLMKKIAPFLPDEHRSIKK